MTQLPNMEPDETQVKGRSRSPNKPFPSITFEDALVIPRGILAHSVAGDIQRLTLSEETGMSPTSSKTRGLISGSFKYGLTKGSYNSPSLSVTESGHELANAKPSTGESRKLAFHYAVGQFPSFQSVYEKLKDKRLPVGRVLEDEFGNQGVSIADRPQAAEIFTANIRFLGLTREISGSEYVSDIDSLPDHQPDAATSQPTEQQTIEPTPEQVPNPIQSQAVAPPVQQPSLHIDIQIHIDSNATAELIDSMFASMAKHIYGREG